MLNMHFGVFIRNFIKYNFFYLETKYLSDYNDLIDETLLSRVIPPNSKVAIYGFGPYGKAYFVDIFSDSLISAIFDKNNKSNERLISDPNQIDMNLVSFDYIVVSVMSEKARIDILNFLYQKNISDEKIVLVNYLRQ